MENLTQTLKVWNNGVTSPFNPERPDFVEFQDEIRNKTGAKFGISTRWIYQGKTYENAHCPIPIPDLSGLVYATDEWKRWVVLNPDNTTKFIIDVPRISAKSVPENGELGEPKYMKGDLPNIMYGEGSDGDRNDCRFYFNMHTGELLRVEIVGRHW